MKQLRLYFLAMQDSVPFPTRKHGFGALFRFLLIASMLALLCVPTCQAQEPPEAPKPQGKTKSVKTAAPAEHRFWDRTNGWLFAGVGASRTLDYFSTLNMRRRGRQEILLTNDAVDNHAAFATIEAAGTSVSIGAAYLFHKTGHHKLERWTSIVHISAATTGSVRNYCLKTAHPAPPTTP